MAETANSKHDSTHIKGQESNTNSINVQLKTNKTMQSVSLGKDRPFGAKKYTSPFLAEKTKIDAKFVHLQCIWRDLEQSKQLGKKQFKERQIDHTPRSKIKRKDDYLDPKAVVQSGLTPEFKSGVSRLLYLERKLDENENEVNLANSPEYTNVVFSQGDAATNSGFQTLSASPTAGTQTDVRKQESSNNHPARLSPIQEEKAFKTPLKFNIKSFRAKSGAPEKSSASAHKSSSHGPHRYMYDATKVTLTKPNLPGILQSPSGAEPVPEHKESKEETDTRATDQSTEVHAKRDLQTLKRFYENLDGAPEKVSPAKITKSQKSATQEVKKTDANQVDSRKTQVASVQIHLDSSLSEDESLQLSPAPEERKISVKSFSPSSPDLRTDHGKPASDSARMEVTRDADKETNTANQRSLQTSDDESFSVEVQDSRSFQERRLLFGTPVNTKRKTSSASIEEERFVETNDQPNGSFSFWHDNNRDNQNIEISARKHNIPSTSNRIGADPKQSKEAAGHVKTIDEATKSNAKEQKERTAEDINLKMSSEAKGNVIHKTDAKSDEQTKLVKETKTSTQKASVGAEEVEDSKSQGVDNVPHNTTRVVDKAQTKHEEQDHKGKSLHSEKTDNLRVMNNNADSRKPVSNGHEKETTNENTLRNAIPEMNHLRESRRMLPEGKNDINETSHEIVPLRGGGEKRIVRHRSSKGSGQEPEEVATELQKALLTSKKVIESQLAGILDKRIECDNLVGALKRSMTKPTAREKVTAATQEINEIIQNEITEDENGRKVHRVRVQMGSFTSDINYTQDDNIVTIEGSTTQSPTFTKEIKVEFSSKGLDMELMSVHSEESVVEINVPFQNDTSQTNGAVHHTLDQYIHDEVNTLKREYMLPWMLPESGLMPTATPVEHSTEAPSSPLPEPTDANIHAREETLDTSALNDRSRSPSVRQVPPPPTFSPPAPPPTALDLEDDSARDSSGILRRGKRPRRLRPKSNVSQSSNASVSSSDASVTHVMNANNSNNNDSDFEQLVIADQTPQAQLGVAAIGPNLATCNGARAHRSRRHRRSVGKCNGATGRSSAGD